MSRHLKSYAAPKSWIILRKTTKWIIKPHPGSQPLQMSMPIGLLLKQLGCGKTTREIKKILNQKAVLVDGKAVKDAHFAAGFMDTIFIKPGTALRGSLDEKGRLRFINITEPELSKKICKITGKRTVTKGRIQLNLSNSRNVLVEKGKHAVGDSLLLELPSQKIADHFPFAKGSLAFLIGGRHTGKTATIDDVQGNRVWLTTAQKEKIETRKEVAIVIGKDKPAVKL